LTLNYEIIGSGQANKQFHRLLRRAIPELSDESGNILFRRVGNAAQMAYAWVKGALPVGSDGSIGGPSIKPLAGRILYDSAQRNPGRWIFTALTACSCDGTNVAVNTSIELSAGAVIKLPLATLRFDNLSLEMMQRLPALADVQSPVERVAQEEKSLGRRLSELAVDKSEPLSEMDPGLETTEQDLYQMAAFVFCSPYVQTNSQYRDCAGKTRFYPMLGNPIVNAFATQSIDIRGKREPGPWIVFFGGAANACKLAAIAGAAACEQAVGNGYLLRVIKAMGACIAEAGSLPLDRIREIANETGLRQVLGNDNVLREGRSLAAGMHMGIIAHELGHIALGHTLREGPLGEGASRDQERMADSFANAVVNESLFAKYLVTGTIIWWIILVWCEHSGNVKVASTHPLSRERLRNFIEANEAQAKAIGIDTKTIEEFLPPQC
jgi:hypothetical protein